MGEHHQNLLNNLEELRKSAGLTQQDLSESAEALSKLTQDVIDTHIINNIANLFMNFFFY